MAWVAVATAVISAGATITTGAIKDSTQRKKNQAELALKERDQRLKELSAAQKHALDVRIANAKTDTERLAIYNDTLSKLGSATISSTASILQAGVSQKSTQNYLGKSIILASGFLLIGGTIYILRKK